jgi:phosphoribosyl-ATP pyrophosphohydrolase/phosphoribosyl-AMP cyclohydrolase
MVPQYCHVGLFRLDPQEVLDELARRQGLSGLVEKANRSKEA